MKCPACGTMSDPGASFCKQCRAPLVDAGTTGRLILGGRFRVLRSLGKGGMGEILLAEDIKLGRKVAVKSVSPGALGECDSKARFQREARAASRLDHANICTIYEIAEEEGREFIIMQYIDGVTLDQLMKMKPLSLAQVLQIAGQTAAALTAAQERGVVHRDIKPGNIMIDRGGQVKILDFGLAKMCGEKDAGEEHNGRDVDLTEKGVILGTVSYMSPEQAKGWKLDSRSDMFSFGVVLFEMIEGRNPFSDAENIVTLYNILHREPRFSRPIPASLQAVIERCLQKDRTRRYANFAQIEQALNEVQAEFHAHGRKAAANETEIIDARDLDGILEDGSASTAASDEHLSEMVRRLKLMKASTEALRSGRSQRGRWLAAALLLAASVGAVWFFALRGRPPAALPRAAEHVLVFPFENQTSDPRLGEEIDFLIQEALNQTDAFKALPEATVRALEGGAAIETTTLAALAPKYGIRHVLRGQLTGVADKVNIEASLSALGETEDHPPFFIPGKEKNSLLRDQIDNLARRVRETVCGGRDAQRGVRPGLPHGGHGEKGTPLAAMYGDDWHAFERFYQGKVLWDKKEFGAARRLLLEAEATGAGVPAAGYYLALLADYTGDANEALRRLQGLLPQLSRFSPALGLEVMALKAKFDFDFQKQRECLARLKAMFPFHKERIFELGEAYFRRGDAARAIPEYEAALALDPDYGPALNHLGYCYSYLGRHSQAIESFERYRDIDRTANSFDSLGDGYFYLGDYTQAENSKIYAVSLDGTMDWPYLTLADIAILRADYREAEKCLDAYRKLASYPKAQADALAKRAFIRCLEGEPKEALALLAEALRRHDSASIHDHSAQNHWLAGLCHVSRGDLAAARRELVWLRALCSAYRLSEDNFDPALKFTLHLEARLAEAERRPKQADGLYRRLLAMKTQLSFWITYYSYPFFLTEYAGFLRRSGEAQAALEAIHRCLEFNPDYPPALWALLDMLKTSEAGDARRKAGEVARRLAALYGDKGGLSGNPLRERLARELSDLS